MWNDFVYGLGDFFQWTFKILPTLGDLPNNIFILVGFGLFFYWIKEQNRYNKEAEKNGTLK
jgi:hypothetical protein